MAFKDILEKGKAIFSRDEHIEQKTRPSIEQLEEDAKYLAGKAGALKISLWVSKEEGTEKPQGALDDYAKRLAIAEANLAKRKEEHDRLVEANLETGKKGERIERLSNIEKDLETARQTLK